MRNQKATAQSWAHKSMPEQQKRVKIEGQFSLKELEKIERGLIPKSKNDKWFIYYQADWLNFYRSHTGTCIYQLQLRREDQTVSASEMILNRDPAQYNSRDDEFDVAMAAYLIETLLLGRFAPLPQPKGLRQQDVGRFKKEITGRSDDGNGTIPLQINHH